MGKLAIQIHLNNDTIQAPGSILTGAVKVTNNGKKEVEIKELYINFIGQEKVCFKNSKCSPRFCCCFYGVGCYYQFRCKKETEYEDGFDFINQSIQLLEPCIIPQGETLHGFQFALPFNSPSTYETSSGKGGFIAYGLSTKMKVPGMLNESPVDSKSIEVRGMSSLSDYSPDIMKPVGDEQTSKKGRINLLLQKQGFLIGEDIHFKVSTLDKKRTAKDPTDISLVQEEQLIAKRFGAGSKIKRAMIVTQKWSPAGESDEFMGIIRIPTGLVPTDLGGSQFISLTYFVEFTGFGLIARIPVVIATHSSHEPLGGGLGAKQNEKVGGITNSSFDPENEDEVSIDYESDD